MSTSESAGLKIFPMPAKAAVCTYGYKYVRDPRTLIVTAKCKTWWEY